MYNKYNGREIGSIGNEIEKEIVCIAREIFKEQIENAFNKEKEENKKILRDIEEILEWKKQNDGKKPKQFLDSYIKKNYQDEASIENESEEQKEIRLGMNLRRIKHIARRYKDVPLEYIEDETLRKIVDILRQISVESNVKEEKDLKKAKEIQEWLKKYDRRPKTTKDGTPIKAPGKGEKETPEQEERRICTWYRKLKAKIEKEYGYIEKINTDKIENDVKRQTIEIIKQANKRYFVNSVDATKLVGAVFNLIKTRHATAEQIWKMAEYYGVDLNEIQFYKDESIDEIEER